IFFPNTGKTMTEWKSITVRLPPDLYRHVQNISLRARVPLSAVIIAALYMVDESKADMFFYLTHVSRKKNL
ncbi:MAG: hypothetical protein QW544_03530, partial [Candidatus Caldarchaeum sp.]